MTEDVMAEDSLAESLETTLSRLAEDVELTSIRFVKVAGELLVDEPADVHEVGFKVSMILRVCDDHFDCRFEIDAPVYGSDGVAMADLGVIVVASFSVAPNKRPSRELARQFMERVAFFVAIPFVREALQATSTRLGIGPLTIGLLHQGRDVPVVASVGSARHEAG